MKNNDQIFLLGIIAGKRMKNLADNSNVNLSLLILFVHYKNNLIFLNQICYLADTIKSRYPRINKIFQPKKFDVRVTNKNITVVKII